MSVFAVKVKGLPGTYIANQHGAAGHRPQTLITFNQGGYWSPIAASSYDAAVLPTNCSLVSTCYFYYVGKVR